MRLDSRWAPEAALVVVVDVQNDFCHPDGVSGRLGRDLTAVTSRVGHLETFLEGSRAAGIPVVFVRTTHDDTTDSPAWRHRRGSESNVAACRPGTWGAEFFRCLPRGSDMVATKHRYSAFSSPEFCEALEASTRTSLLFTGIATSICVESTLREAVSRDYRVTLVEDCCMDYAPAAHEASVRVVQGAFGLIARSGDLLTSWSSTAPGPVPVTPSTP